MMSFHVVNTTLENGQQFIIGHSMEMRRKRRKWAGLMSINYWTQVVSGDKSVRVASKYALSDVLLNTHGERVMDDLASRSSTERGPAADDALLLPSPGRP